MKVETSDPYLFEQKKTDPITCPNHAYLCLVSTAIYVLVFEHLIHKLPLFVFCHLCHRLLLFFACFAKFMFVILVFNVLLFVSHVTCLANLLPFLLRDTQVTFYWQNW